jgi:SAM-dependent methyltransferase
MRKIKRQRLYDAHYYACEGPAASERSARIVVPHVFSILRPKSVIDVGCGTGAWLAEFRTNGVERTLGLDGDHIDPAQLLIPTDMFMPVDLSDPLQLQEKFELAICLEVAEHLPKRCSATLVRSLVGLSPVILFSAAIPLQGGTHHVNEQWPDYWHLRFAQYNYRPLDLIRKRIWKNSEVEFWYRQNIFFYVREDLVTSNPEFVGATQDANDLLLVHHSILERQLGLRCLLRNLPASILRTINRRLRGGRF